MKIGDRVVILADKVPGRPIPIPKGTFATITEIGHPGWGGDAEVRYRLLYDGYVVLSSDVGLYDQGFWFQQKDFAFYSTAQTLPDPEFSLEEIEKACSLLS